MLTNLISHEQKTGLINYLNSKQGLKHTVSLHIDREDNEHNIYINTFVRYSEQGQKIYATHMITLEGVAEKDCYIIVDEAFKLVKCYDTSAVKKEYIHE